MKQHITVEQLNELGDKREDKLIEWRDRTKQEQKSLLLSIGQMIEFLSKDGLWKYPPLVYDKAGDEAIEINKLCDALWEAVKKVLETT